MNTPQPKPGNPPQDDGESLEDYADRCKTVRLLPAATDKLPGHKWVWLCCIAFGIPVALTISQIMWCVNLMIFDWWTKP